MTRRSVRLPDGSTRSWTWARDHIAKTRPHVCDECGLDCDDVSAFVRLCREHAPQAPKAIRQRWLVLAWEGLADSWRERELWKVPAMLVLRPLGFQPVDLERVHVFDVDHITPVAEDAEPCELDNLRVLCAPCHRDVTAGFNRHRVKRGRRAARKTRPTIPSRPLPKGRGFPKQRRWPKGKRRVKRAARWEPSLCSKRGYPSRTQALRANATNGTDLTTYWCPSCSAYHCATRTGKGSRP